MCGSRAHALAAGPRVSRALLRNDFPKFLRNGGVKTTSMTSGTIFRRSHEPKIELFSKNNKVLNDDQWVIEHGNTVHRPPYSSLVFIETFLCGLPTPTPTQWHRAKELMHLLICEANAALLLTEGYFTKIVLLICKYNSLSHFTAHFAPS